MSFDNDTLNAVFDKTDGRCHLCGRKVSFSNYGANGYRGAWHVEHSTPRALGGTDHLNNLFPACVSCNLEKGTRATRTVRAWYGRSRAPISASRKEELRNENTIVAAAVGCGLGAIFGTRGAVVGGLVGLAIGTNLPVE